MEVCKECGRPKLSQEELEKILTNPYLVAISDKKFLDYLGGVEHGQKV
jgi:hypothetical protein